MLVLTLNHDNVIQIGDDIRLLLPKSALRHARIAIDAPAHLAISRHKRQPERKRTRR